MSADWAQLETHVVNGAFPLQRCVGSTDHSGVFLTQATKHAPSAVALKLVPDTADSSEALLDAWRVAAGLSHPHLLRIFEVGRCLLGGSDYLFARMEFAEQTLAQLLEQRALTEEETRDLLAPTLDALEYLHRQGLVHAGLKPSNVLVVADRLKLAADTVLPMGPHGSEESVASDIRALGVLLCVALTRVAPLIRPDGDVELPRGLPSSFIELLKRCLNPEPVERPDVSELKAWLVGDPTIPAAHTLQQVTSSVESPATRLRIRVDLTPAEIRPRTPPSQKSASQLPWLLGAMVLAGLGWFGYRAFSPGVSQPAAPVPVPVAGPPAPVAPPVAPARDPEPPAAIASTSPAAVDEVLPQVSKSSLDTIRGTLRVSIRVTVGADGQVISAVTDNAGPSRYFETRALEASKKWTFTAAESEQRTFRLRFAFTRSGVSASTEPLK
ncbi:MAG: TonB family protein [Steroidobacteraceae bacterium]